jgi:AraC-like DNA-binding protein
MSLRQTVLAQSSDWRICDYRCTAGPEDRPFEEVHEGVSISLVVAGTFEYRTASGEALLYPGAYLLGNSGECFECGHRHGVGDRCIAVQVTSCLFEEIAASAAGTSGFKFRTPSLPPLKSMAGHSLRLHSFDGQGSVLALEADVCELIESAICTVTAQAPQRVAAHDKRRISKVLRHMDYHSATDLDLDALAAVATMSKYHFLRTFRRVTGATPHRYLMDVRLRRAALALTRRRESVAFIALNEGFDDISTFNRYFKLAYQATPTQFRTQKKRHNPCSSR